MGLDYRLFDNAGAGVITGPFEHDELLDALVLKYGPRLEWAACSQTGAVRLDRRAAAEPTPGDPPP